MAATLRDREPDGRKRTALAGSRIRARIIGAYSIPFYPSVIAVEVLIPAPAHLVDTAHFAPYRPVVDDHEIGIGVADFYLSDDGERLLCCYLQALPVPLDDDEARPGSNWRSRCRIILLLTTWECPDAFFTPWGKLRMPKITPLPDRLLRLIWIDEEMIAIHTSLATDYLEGALSGDDEDADEEDDWQPEKGIQYWP